jgi:HEAT repeat protein
MLRRVGLSAALFAGFVLGASSAYGQALARPPVARPGEVEVGGRLLDRFGVAAGRRLVDDPSPSERRRGIERLAELGTPEAIEALIGAMDSGSPLARDPVLRIHAVRLLARHAGNESVRSYLVRELMDAASRRDAPGGLPTLLRETAALALARDGGEDATRALATAAALRGPAGDAARLALVVAPPPTLDAFLYDSSDADEDEDADRAASDDDEQAGDDGRKEERAEPSRKKGKADAKDATKDAPRDGEVKKKDRKKREKTPRLLTPLTMTLLGDLGDLRAVPALRGELDRSDRTARAAAAIALAKLGDATAGDVALGWSKEKDPRLAVAAADVLVMLGRPEAPLVLKKALADDASKVAAVRLALDLASPELVAPLKAALASLEARDAARAMTALGRAGELDLLVAKISDPVLAPAAMNALASSPAEGADATITAGLAGKERRRFARVGVVRALVTGREVDGLVDVLGELVRSKDAADREAGALGLVALGESTPAELIPDPDKADLAVVSGAARGALARPTAEVLEGLLPLLEKIDPEAPSMLAVAAGVALWSPELSDRVPRDALLRLAESGGPLAAVAARALPRRDDGTIGPRVGALLDGTDPSVRVAVALGYADASDQDTSARLGRAYTNEEDVRVRRALVWVLAGRSEPQRDRYLRWARDLDPDHEVRALARGALSGRKRPSLGGAGPVSHAALVTEVRAGTGTSPVQALRLVLPSGVALPMVSAADGGLVVPGVPFGRSQVELAPGARAADSPTR